jgi:hypothetical protein
VYLVYDRKATGSDDVEVSQVWNCEVDASDSGEVYEPLNCDLIDDDDDDRGSSCDIVDFGSNSDGLDSV